MSRRRPSARRRSVPPAQEQDRLPAILAGQVPPHERRLRWLQRSAIAGSTTGAMLVVVDLAAGSPMNVGIAGGFLLAGSAGGAVARWLGGGPYPHLGRRRRAWVAAGASAQQLRLLDEAHRLWALTPPVGYRDRRTVINPLADAYAIFTSPAWRDSWLADHKLQIDPVVEAAEIIDYMHRVTGVLAEVRVKLRTVPPRSAARRTYDEYERALIASLDDGLRRARALSDYRAEVRRLERVLAQSRALPEAEAFADRVLDVVSESARQELATAQLDDSRAQLRVLESGLREITELLGSDVRLPARPQH